MGCRPRCNRHPGTTRVPICCLPFALVDSSSDGGIEGVCSTIDERQGVMGYMWSSVTLYRYIKRVEIRPIYNRQPREHHYTGPHSISGFPSLTDNRAYD